MRMRRVRTLATGLAMIAAAVTAMLALAANPAAADDDCAMLQSGSSVPVFGGVCG